MNYLLTLILSVSVISCLTNEDKSDLSSKRSSFSKKKNPPLSHVKQTKLAQAKYCIAIYTRGISGMSPVGTASYYKVSCDNGVHFFTDKNNPALTERPYGTRVPGINSSDQRADEIKTKMVNFMKSKGFKIAEYTPKQRWVVFSTTDTPEAQYVFIRSYSKTATKISYSSYSSHAEYTTDVREAPLSSLNSFIENSKLSPVLNLTNGQMDLKNTRFTESASGYILYKVAN